MSNYAGVSLLVADSDNRHLDGRDKDYDTGPFVSAVNLILQKQILGVINQSNAVRVGQNKYFSLAEQSYGLSLGLEARRGYFMSVRPMYKGLMVNVNACMAAFYAPGNMAQAMFAFRDQTQGGMPSKFAQRLQIETTHLGYRKRRGVLRIERNSARQQQFSCAELGGTVTVEKYFHKSKHPSCCFIALLVIHHLRV